jgi:hypothetical protein
MADKSSSGAVIGRMIGGKYRIAELLGAGGFGGVYKATHAQTGGAVAVKLLWPQQAQAPDVIERFEAEARNTSRLHHPNTVRIVDYGLETGDGTLFLVMEYVAGRPLSKLIAAESPLSTERALRVVRQVLKSLGEAHGHQIIHRDIKPDNIMLVDQFGEPDFVKVVDFGISKVTGAAGPTRANTVVGSMHYMAPERWLGTDADARSDLYAVGCVLFELLTGESPWRFEGGADADQGAWIGAHLHRSPRRLGEVAGRKFPEPLEALVRDLIAKLPEERPSSAQEVLDRIDGWPRAHRWGGEIAREAASHGATDTASEDDRTRPLEAPKGMLARAAVRRPPALTTNVVPGAAATGMSSIAGRRTGHGTVLLAGAVALVLASVGVFVAWAFEPRASQGPGVEEALPPEYEASLSASNASSPDPVLPVLAEAAVSAPNVLGDGSAVPPPHTDAIAPSAAVPEEREAGPPTNDATGEYASAIVEDPPASARRLRIATSTPGAVLLDRTGGPIGPLPLEDDLENLRSRSPLRVRAPDHRSTEVPLPDAGAPDDTNLELKLVALPQLKLDGPRAARFAYQIGDGPEADISTEGRTPWLVDERVLEALESGTPVTLRAYWKGGSKSRALTPEQLRQGKIHLGPGPPTPPVVRFPAPPLPIRLRGVREIER